MLVLEYIADADWYEKVKKANVSQIIAEPITVKQDNSSSTNGGTLLQVTVMLSG